MPMHWKHRGHVLCHIMCVFMSFIGPEMFHLPLRASVLMIHRNSTFEHLIFLVFDISGAVIITCDSEFKHLDSML